MFKRIIGVVLVDNGIVCRTRNFVSDYFYTDAFIDTNLFDEIVFIDVTKNRSDQTLKLFLTTIEKLMSESQLPMAIGGGISSINDIIRFREFGADRYIINQTSPTSDEFVRNAIDKFGINVYADRSVNDNLFGQHPNTEVYNKLILEELLKEYF